MKGSRERSWFYQWPAFWFAAVVVAMPLLVVFCLYVFDRQGANHHGGHTRLSEHNWHHDEHHFGPHNHWSFSPHHRDGRRLPQSAPKELERGGWPRGYEVGPDDRRGERWRRQLRERFGNQYSCGDRVTAPAYPMPDIEPDDRKGRGRDDSQPRRFGGCVEDDAEGAFRWREREDT